MISLCVLEALVDIITEQGPRKVRLNRIHLEEDAGKLIHQESEPVSFVDYNRTGTPLIEIVTEPDIHSPREAYEYLKALKQVLEYLDVSDCNMEEGSLRCDANVSVRPEGSEKLGTKTEVKNMNSFSGVEKALEYEIDRQISVLDEGGRIVQETRLWDADRQFTRSMRSKEEAHDYRYFPEPDLVPVIIEKSVVDEIRSVLPELPAVRKQRFIDQFGLPEYDAGVLTSTKSLADYYESALKAHNNPKIVSNWVMGEFLKKVNETGISIKDSSVTPELLAGLVSILDDGKISGKIAKDVFEEMF